MKRVIKATEYKRIAKLDEYDNPHILRGDFVKISSDEAEERARRASLKDPTKVYYVQNDDVMNPSSDIRWVDGVPYSYKDVFYSDGRYQVYEDAVPVEY